MRRYIAIGFILAGLASAAQQDSLPVRGRMELISRVRTLVTDSLGLQVGEHFYTRFAENDSMFCYVYVSGKDSIRSPIGDAYIYFGNYPVAAMAKADSFARAGFDAIVYRTAGTSGAYINRRLLSYDNLSLTFILIHEAVHRHVHNSRSKLPYEFEESLGDVIANSFCGWYSGATLKSYLDFASRNEQIYRLINRCSAGKLSKVICERKISSQLRQATLFQEDRYRYPVNNAYLLRYSSYAKHYFQLRELYEKMHNPRLFLEEMMKMPGNVEECEQAIQLLLKKY
jgi:hypothetical protein